MYKGWGSVHGKPIGHVAHSELGVCAYPRTEIGKCRTWYLLTLQRTWRSHHGKLPKRNASKPPRHRDKAVRQPRRIQQTPQAHADARRKGSARRRRWRKAATRDEPRKPNVVPVHMVGPSLGRVDYGLRPHCNAHGAQNKEQFAKRSTSPPRLCDAAARQLRRATTIPARPHTKREQRGERNAPLAERGNARQGAQARGHLREAPKAAHKLHARSTRKKTV